MLPCFKREVWLNLIMTSFQVQLALKFKKSALHGIQRCTHLNLLLAPPPLLGLGATWTLCGRRPYCRRQRDGRDSQVRLGVAPACQARHLQAEHTDENQHCAPLKNGARHFQNKNSRYTAEQLQLLYRTLQQHELDSVLRHSSKTSSMLHSLEQPGLRVRTCSLIGQDRRAGPLAGSASAVQDAALPAMPLSDACAAAGAGAGTVSGSATTLSSSSDAATKPGAFARCCANCAGEQVSLTYQQVMNT